MKLAFMFLITENHNQKVIWNNFFNTQNQGLYNVYCHARFPHLVTQTFLKNNIIPELISTKHADISIVKAILLLLKRAFEDTDNEYFILLSESCIPLYSFQYVYNTLKNSQKSYIDYGSDSEDPETYERWKKLKDPSFISFDKFAKQHAWMILTREVVNILLQHDYTQIFEQVYCPDEHYFINLLIKMNFPLEEKVINKMVTFVNWQEYEVEIVTETSPDKGQRLFQKIRPKTYHQLSVQDVLGARRDGCLFFRKVASDCDCTAIEAAETFMTEALKTAVQYHQGNHPVAAEQAYRQILETYPNHPEALSGLGMLFQQKGQLQEAEKFLTTAVQIDPVCVKAWFSLGNLHQTQGQLAAAEIAYRQALTLQPNVVVIHSNLGYNLQQQGKFDEAIACYQKALKLKPDFIEAEANLGNALHAQGKLSNERQLYYAQLNQKLGDARKKARDLETAVAYYKQALALQPNLVEAHHKLGVALQEQGELEEAMACYQRVLELNSNYVEVYFDLGKIYQQQKQLEQAAAAYRQWLKLINPHYAQAVEAYQDAETTQEEFVTPPIPSTEVTVGAYQFPAIPLVSDAEKARPFWSVVVPVYNRTDYLLECLASVLAQWSGKEEMEILVMDNASTSPLFELINSIGQGVVRYYKNPQNLGLPGNWNAGVVLSRGQWIHILHDDDYVLPGFYAQLKQSLEGCSESVGAAFTGYENINEKEQITFSQQVYGEHKGIAKNWLQQIGVSNPLNPPAVIVRRLAYERLGGYHPELTFTTDWELYKRIATFYDWWYEPGILARFRQHSRSMTSDLLRAEAEISCIRQAIEISKGYLAAEHCAEITAKARSHYFNYCLARATNLLEAGNPVGASRVLQEALKIDRSSDAVAKLFAWLKQDEAALLRAEIASKLISLPLNDNEAPQLVVEQHQINFLEQTEQGNRKITSAQPDNPEALHRLGLQAQLVGQPQEAEKFFSAALQIQPEFVQAWFSLGNLHQTQGQLAAAEVAYRQALALQPNLVAIHNNLGYTLQQQGKFDEAIAHYQKALEIQPNCTEADVNLGNALYVQGKLSPEQQAHYSILNEQLGIARLEARDLTTAITYLRQAIVLQADSLKTHYNLGIALERQDNLEEAIACFETVLELNPNYGEAYLNLGGIYQKQKQLQKAIAAYRQGLNLINPCYAKAVEAYQKPDVTNEVPVTPPILLGEVVVGDYSFPAIAPLSDKQGKRPFWTVIIPVYQRTEYILNCLAGVLAQWPGEDEMEILVLDNASTPPLFDLVNSIGRGVVKYYRQPQNLGVVGNENVGIALSRGEWVHILHDDDCVYPGFYSRLQQSLKNCPQSVGYACTGFNYINEKGEKIAPGEVVSLYGDNRGILQNWLQQTGVCGLIVVPGVVVRRTTHEHLGGYAPELIGIDEWELYKRIAVFYDCWYEPGILVGYRVHLNRESSKNWLSGSLPKAIRRAIEITSSYLPDEYNAEITAKTRRHNFNYCMRHAGIPLKAGNLDATFRIIQEALKIDHSSEAVAKLFDWLNQDEAALLREEIVSKLLLNTD